MARGKYWQDPMQGAPMVVGNIPRAQRPKMRYGQDYLPGTGYVKINPMSKATPWPGGVFGQPNIPYNRQGIFEAKWPMPPSMAYNDTGVFTPHTQQRIPGTSMDSGVPLYSVLNGLGDTAAEVGAGAEGLWRSLSDLLFGGPEVPPQQQQAEKRAWLRAAVVVGVLGYWVKRLEDHEGK